MKREYDFSKGERGKFFRPNGKARGRCNVINFVVKTRHAKGPLRSPRHARSAGAAVVAPIFSQSSLLNGKDRPEERVA
jgi:hypothetical protein